jgi:hypothetical protein
LRFELKKNRKGVTEIRADSFSLQYLAYLQPFLNSKEFWQNFDKHILPILGSSPYFQIEFMYKLQHPAKQITEYNQNDFLKDGEVNFIIDIIAGIHESNSKKRDQVFKNPHTNGSHNQIAPFINDIDPGNFSGAKIVDLTVRELKKNKDYLAQIYELLLRTVPGRYPLTGHEVSNILSEKENGISLENARRERIVSRLRKDILLTHRALAHGLLKTKSIWLKNSGHIPHMLDVLEDIAKKGFSSRTVSEVIAHIENRVFQPEIDHTLEVQDALEQRELRDRRPLLIG